MKYVTSIGIILILIIALLPLNVNAVLIGEEYQTPMALSVMPLTGLLLNLIHQL